MKKIMLLAYMAICLVSCTSKSTDNKENDTDSTSVTQVSGLAMYPLDSLLAEADQRCV